MSERRVIRRRHRWITPILVGGALLAALAASGWAAQRGSRSGAAEDRRHVRVLVPIAEGGRHRLTLHDGAGRRVRLLRDTELPAGRIAMRWDGRDDLGAPLPSGRYALRLDGAAVGSLRLLR